jgi:cytosine/adenosine deaminase-related metal-dependent hydrolase
MAADSATPSRRSVLSAGAAALATVAAGPALAADAERYVLRNVRLETGSRREGDEVAETLTSLANVHIAGGAIAAVTPASTPLAAGARSHDMAGLLMLPAFRDMHIHLDKTFYGDPWRAPRRKHGIPGQIALEQKLLPELLPGLEGRADRLVNLLQANGTTFARSQCNVDPVIGVQNVVHLKRALDRRNATFGHEIVAFPQHGLVKVNLQQTMRDAMAAGATHVGGIDPTTVDGDMERSVDAVLQIALDCKAPIDMHLHEPGESGVAAIRRIAERVEQTPELRGRVTFSHCFCLMSLDDAQLADLAARMAALGMSVASTVPLGTRMMPIPALQAKGVAVYTGTDTVVDHWGVFGTGDVLEKAKLACQLYGWSDEYGLSQSLKLATGGPTPLNAAGEQVWPKPGDPADCVFVAAACSAETVARTPPRRTVLHQGRLAAGAFPA